MAVEEAMEDARNRIMVAFWFETFRLIAGLKNSVLRSRGLGLLGMSTFLRITTLGNLEGLRLCNLWILMKLLKLNTI